MSSWSKPRRDPVSRRALTRPEGHAPAGPRCPQGPARLKPVQPGERGGKVVGASRRDGGLALRFRDKCRKYQGVTGAARPGGFCPRTPGVERWGGRCQRGKRKRPRARRRGPGRRAYRRPPGARAALLRGPILLTARGRIPPGGGGVQPKRIPGGRGCGGGGDRSVTADLATVANMRTFLLLSDTAAVCPLAPATQPLQ